MPGAMAAREGAGNPPAVIVAGPTCSGKSALALMLARAVGGTIVNADAMQTYRDLRVLTARPGVAEEAEAPHMLYGFRPVTDAGGAASWRREALAAMARTVADGRVPILCGGTGLYFSALIEGLAEIPDPGAAARAEARGLLAEIGPAWLHERLAAADPVTAARLRPTDGQRIARAWEVWRGTGTGLAAWQAAPGLKPAPYRFFAVRLDPPRPDLRDAIAARFGAMLAAGGLEEVRRLVAQAPDPALPLMRAHGVPELSAVLRGELALGDAAARAVAATMAYTKRQATWLRHHRLAPDRYCRIINARFASEAQFSESFMADLQNFLWSAVDVPLVAP